MDNFNAWDGEIKVGDVITIPLCAKPWYEWLKFWNWGKKHAEYRIVSSNGVDSFTIEKSK